MSGYVRIKREKMLSGDMIMLRYSHTNRRLPAAAAPLLLLLLLFTVSAHAGTFTVSSTEDAGTHSLRWAITQANATPGPDIINFRIPGDGPHTILLRSALPALTDDAGLIIDGLSQDGAGTGPMPPSTLSVMITLDGSLAGEVPGLIIKSSNNVVQGLAFVRFALEGLRFQATPFGTSDNMIRHCIVGSSEGRIPAANGLLAGDVPPAGISLYSPANEGGDIRGNAIMSCIISGNSGDGLLLLGNGGAIANNQIRGNFIGVSKSGSTALANTGNGIALLGNCTSNEISGNVISGNQLNGIRIAGDATSAHYGQKNVITQNSIGVGVDQNPVGNGRDGINLGSDLHTGYAGFVCNNSITGNTISGNNRNGISVWEHPSTADNADGNRISNNSIFANRKLAIDLGDDGVTMNNRGDNAHGANQNINSPIITSAEFTGGVAIVKGHLDRNAGDEKLSIEMYRYRSYDTRKTEGSLFLGSIPVNGDGNWVFSTSGVVVEGDSIFATVIDRNGNTSEFSSPSRLTSVQLAEVSFTTSRPASDKAAVVSILAIEPNPVMEYTEISLFTERNTWAIIQVYTPNGELVETIYDRWLTNGEHKISWNAKNWKGVRVNPGWYVCVVDADASRSERKFEVGDVSLGAIDR
jgi:hypothetical protein